MDEKMYDVLMEQRRAVATIVSAPNQKEAKARALELLEEGALDDGFAFPPGLSEHFKVKVVGIKEKKRRG